VAVEAPAHRVHEAERLYTAAADLTAARLTALADELDLSTITEARHLQPTFRRALEEIAVTATPRPVVSPRLAHGLKNEWPRLGNFDISLEWSGVEVFGELKCGETELTLSACGWDAAKSAFCLNHGFGTAMLLIVAAPLSLWEAPSVGIELLFDGEWDMADVRARYAAGFRTWERDGYKPAYVFRRLRTVGISRTTSFRIGRKQWLLGISRVEAIDRERMDWIPLLVPRPHDMG
jgi:hypothetical protein